MKQKTILKQVLTSILFILGVLLSMNLSAQRYAVYFTNKDNSPYSVSHPEKFLSQRALDRRGRLGIEIITQDLPVNPQYVKQLKDLGALVPFTSKWLNCALISCSEAVINQIVLLPFVSHYVYIRPGSYFGKSEEITVAEDFDHKFELEERLTQVNSREIAEQYGYGNGYMQINQINGIPVHKQGFTGEGMLIAVLDGGFRNVPKLPFFDEEKVVFEMDVANPNGNFYGSSSDSHGTLVLSCIAANAENKFVGTAPNASFALIRTEDAETEYLIECYNWVVGAEAADSIGADIINTSVGYKSFYDASMNYTYDQMDGESTVASFAAKTAVEKGIFVTAAAGNTRASSWPWITSPADAAYIATIGAVDSLGEVAYFSSIGPNSVGVPKPNVLAQGYTSTVYTITGEIATASGTSFSSPIACGMYACLIQANPNIHPKLLRDIVDKTGNGYPNHDIAAGYGIPDFAAALDSVLALNIMEFVNVEINDSQGNNDGKLNLGETVSLNITLKNRSQKTLNNVNACVSIYNPDITWNNKIANCGTLAPEQTKTINSAFTFTLDENALPNQTLNFYVTFNYDNKTVQRTFSLDTYGNLVEYQTYAIDQESLNTNHILEPGETANLIVTVVNNGNVYAGGVTAVLSSTSNIVTINSNSAYLGNMIPTQTKYATYNISISNDAVAGAVSIPFELQLTDDQGKTKTFNFIYNDKCNIIFELRDSYYDGWNGAAIEVSFNDGTPSQSVTVTTGCFATYKFGVAVGTEVTLSWKKGTADGECSFVIKHEDGEIIYKALYHTTAGVFHVFENNCGCTAAPPNPLLDVPQYAVHFKDKNNSTYSIAEPLAYLSQKAIDRRKKYGITITEDDFPPNLYYVENVSMTGASVRAESRWANAVLVYADSAMLEAINKLDFVEKTVYVKPAAKTTKQPDIQNKWINELSMETTGKRSDFEYGYAFDQIAQLNGIPVHQKGYTGEGVIIAVLDAGFQKANNVTGFSHLFNSGKIALERNIAEPHRSIYDETISDHGTLVLSCMGGELSGDYVGTAPQASYALIRTEESDDEYLIEEYFWMLGAELADSLGADLINSSLTYTTFDEPSMNHVYSDMDGNTAISSIAAKMAVERGIFVCAGAGNSNGSAWPWVGAPADVPQVLTLGAVNLNGEIADFSSIGPNGAGALKPNVVACGSDAAALLPNNNVATASGTSFSTPITCGLVACIIGATPHKTPAEILQAIQQSANRYPQHDIQYGYGIPNFEVILSTLGINSFENNNSKLIYYPNPTKGELRITNYESGIDNVEVFDIYGKKQKTESRKGEKEKGEMVINISHLSAGIYFLKVGNEMVKVVKL